MCPSLNFARDQTNMQSCIEVTIEVNTSNTDPAPLTAVK